MMTAEEILEKYHNDTDHWADQDYNKEDLLEAMKEYAIQNIKDFCNYYDKYCITQEEINDYINKINNSK